MSGGGRTLNPLPPSSPPTTIAPRMPENAELAYLEPTPSNTFIPTHKGSDSGVADVDSLHVDYLSSPTSLPRSQGQRGSNLSTTSLPRSQGQRGSNPSTTSLPMSQGQRGSNPTPQRSPTSPGQQHGYPAVPTKPGLPSPQGPTAAPPLMMVKRPASIAVKGHEYEELPISRYTDPKQYYESEPEPSDGDSGAKLPPVVPVPPAMRTSANSASNGSTENLCDNNTIVKHPPAYRRRQNPLYDSVIRDDVDYTKKKKSSVCNQQCLWLMLIGLIAIMALVLSVLSITNTVSTGSDNTGTSEPLTGEQSGSLESALRQIEELKEHIQELTTKYTDLQNTVHNLTAEAGRASASVEGSSQIVSNLTMENTKLLSQYTKLSDEVNNVRNTTEENEKSLNSHQAQIDIQQGKITLITSDLDLQNASLNSLTTKVDQLESNQESNLDTTQQDVSSIALRLGSVNTTLYSIDNRLTLRMTDVNSTLGHRIDVVSEMEGPMGPQGLQGPAGVGDLTACERKSVSQGAASSTESSATAWIPKTTTDEQNYVILGIECSVESGTSSLMEVMTEDGYENRYRCVCKGSVSNVVTRRCLMHWWHCPRIT